MHHEGRNPQRVARRSERTVVSAIGVGSSPKGRTRIINERSGGGGTQCAQTPNNKTNHPVLTCVCWLPNKTNISKHH